VQGTTSSATLVPTAENMSLNTIIPTCKIPLLLFLMIVTPSTFVTSLSTTDSAGDTTMIAATVTSVPDNSTSQAEDTAAATGLTPQSKIALGIGLGIGFPSCLASLIGLFIKFREMAEVRERDRMDNIPQNGPESSSGHSTMEK
jgi:hypothetical protein